MTELLGSNPLIVSSVIFLAFSVPIVIFDLRTMKIPDLLIYLGCISMICYRFAFTRREFVIYIISAIISVGLFALVRMLSKLGLGWADVKYSAFCGLYVAPISIFIGYFISALLCALYFLFLRLIGRFNREKAVPFAPFMALGTIIVVLPPIVKLFTK